MTTSGTVVLVYWLMVGVGLVIGGGLALLPVLWFYRKLGVFK
jgi:hypothetical protein